MNLITKYRPNSFDEVVGHSSIVKSLRGICKRKDAQVFLFSGQSGCGKSTLARLVAQAYGSTTTMEIDSAKFTGIDAMRSIQEMVQYKPFGDSGYRAIILDECHGLSKNAFDSLLKVLEEPPKYVVWVFCTTNPDKLPKTLKSRCAHFDLKPVPDKILGELYDSVCEKEQIDLSDDIADLLIREAQGSPRQLLSNLAVVRSATSMKEAAELLRTVAGSKEAIDLCRFIMKGNGSWLECMSLLKKIDGEQPESIRIQISNYLAACLKNAKDDNAAIGFIQKLEAFSQPITGPDAMSSLLLAVGRSLLSE